MSVRNYAILWNGGRKSSAGPTSGGGNQLLLTGQHSLAGPEHTGVFASPALALGTAAAPGSALTTVRSDATIAAFDATAPAPLGTAAAGSAGVASRRDHVHTLPKLDDLAAPDDNTDLNVSTSAHGLTPKLPNDATKYLDGTGAYTVPAGGGGGGSITTVDGALGADSALSAGTRKDLISITLTTGTWDIWGWLQVVATGTGHSYAQITDSAGTTQYGYNLAAPNASGAYFVVPVFAPAVVISGSTTIKLRGQTDNNATAKGTTSLGTGGGTRLHAMKIA